MASKFEETIPMASTGPQPHVVVMATDDSETTPGCCCCDNGCEEENEERGNWSCNFESILASISYGVGPGYLLMAPTIVREGGGTLLYIYMALQIFIGFPMVYLEMALGQYTSQGPIRAWRGVPILQGIGIGMVAMSAILSIYYGGIMAEYLYYLFYVSGDLNTVVSCDNPWNTENCYAGACGQVVEYYHDSYDDTTYNYTYRSCLGPMSAAWEYLDNYVIDKTDGLGDIGDVRGDLAGCLFLVCLLVVAALSFGIKSLGKAAYVTTILPLFFLFLLFLRAVTLPGASTGIEYAFTPGSVYGFSFSTTLISAIVHRLTLGFGGYTTLASYNRFHNNVLRDAIVVVFVDLLVLIFCVLTISGFYGYLAYVSEVDVDAVGIIMSGTRMFSVAMVTVFSQLPSGSSWAALFFLLVFLLSYGSQTVITSLMDFMPRRLINKMPGKDSGLLSKRTVLHGVMTVTVCFLFFLLGLPYVTQGGSYLSSLVAQYNLIIQPYMFVLLECVALTYLYCEYHRTKTPSCRRCCPAIRRWISELSHMLQHVCCFCCATVVNWIAAVCWLSFIPLLMLTWAIVLGHFVFLASAGAVPVVTIVNIVIALVRRKPSEIVQPPADWGPYLNKHRRGVA
ncbi:hypothetical protein Bbelb_301500 [Branchiostoma belcheri]|nr:hypothetical protein Bbelb_301500 [Branchiostoma belcheri]